MFQNNKDEPNDVSNDKKIKSSCNEEYGEDPTADVKVGFPIVGIGASAGGLKALETFFAHMPVDDGAKMSFVVVQHLAPDYKSMLGDLLKQYTRLQVCDAKDGMAVTPNSIYIIPPNRDLTIRNGRLYLSELSMPRGMRLPIDIFFRSLAQDQKEKAICIILSGTGTDGTLGLKAIKGEGGMAMVQDPDSAEYRNMPRSAIATGLVDFILTPEKMPEHLVSFVQYAFGKEPQLVDSLSLKSSGSLQKIFHFLRTQTGHDFSGYKQSTMGRRIERRLAVHQIEHLDDYIRFLRQNSQEVEALFRELLIGVTSFFRDPAAFDVFQEKAIPRLFAGKAPGDSIRVWVPGCSTGEEAYSLAILLKEYQEGLKQNYKVQVFATDIDSRAIEKARAGIYPASIAAVVSPERLKHFFTRDPEGSAYHIQKPIRDMLVFAEQDVTGDPPFSRLDLISCRNLLIFMDGELQKKVLHLFSYALNYDGILFLGNSETIGEVVDLFTNLDRKWKLYQSKKTSIFRPALRNSPSSLIGTSTWKISAGQKESRTGVRGLIEKKLLEQYTPACAVINKRGEVLYIHGRTGKYLEPAPGEMNLNIMQMAREGLKLELNAAIRKATVQKTPVYYKELKVRGNSDTTTVNLTVKPLSEDHPASTGLFLVVFEDVAVAEGVDQWKEEAAAAGEIIMDVRIDTLERELRDKEEYLQTIMEEMETSNEELQSTNEEFQSTNEELETSKEELQSVNEELITVNAELQKKIEELSGVNNDMNNMLAGTGVGTIFVDHQLRIQNYTPPAKKVINLIQNDLGRPVSHIASNLLGYDRLGEDIQEVLNTLVPRELEVQTREQEWYLMRILPYRTMENSIEGAVITFVNISKQMRMHKAVSHLAVVIRDSGDAVTMQDLDGRIMAWNPGAEKMYGWIEAEALAMNIRDTIPEGKREETYEMVLKLAESEKLEPFKTQRLTKGGGIVNVWLTASVLVNQDGKPYAIATTERLIR